MFSGQGRWALSGDVMLAKAGHNVHFFSEWPILIEHVLKNPIAILHYPDHDKTVPVTLAATANAPKGNLWQKVQVRKRLLRMQPDAT